MQNAIESEEAVTVLLIEDDVAIADMYRIRLAADGYSVLTADSGEEGGRVAAGALPDIIYLDIRLPGLDGFEVLEQLRGSPRTHNIPVVILSNDAEPELRERGLKLGALEFLVKADTTPTGLADAVERSTSARRAVSQ